MTPITLVMIEISRGSWRKWPADHALRQLSRDLCGIERRIRKRAQPELNARHHALICARIEELALLLVQERQVPSVCLDGEEFETYLELIDRLHRGGRAWRKFEIQVPNRLGACLYSPKTEVNEHVALFEGLAGLDGERLTQLLRGCKLESIQQMIKLRLSFLRQVASRDAAWAEVVTF